MGNFAIVMTRDEYLLFESCKQLTSIAELAQSEPERAVEMTKALHVPVEVLELRGAVAAWAAGFMRIKEEWTARSISWPCNQEQG